VPLVKGKRKQILLGRRNERAPRCPEREEDASAGGWFAPVAAAQYALDLWGCFLQSVQPGCGAFGVQP